MTAMKETQLVHTDRRKKIRRRLILIILITLTPTFFIGFIVGKSYAADGESIKQNVTEGVEPPISQDKGLNESNKQDLTEEVEEPTTPDQEQTEKKSDKIVYLTFDDGPSKLTDQFLDILREQNVKATFFMQGSNLKKEHLQESVIHATKEGHYIGAHSMTHEYKTLYKENQFVPEMKETLTLIRDITGTTPKLVRPPYGSAPGLSSGQVRSEIVNSGIKVWDWTIDSNDWALKDNPTQIIENIISGTNSDREVVLMHEHPQTLAALPGIIAFFREQGYEFVVYDETDHFPLNFQNDGRL